MNPKEVLKYLNDEKKKASIDKTKETIPKGFYRHFKGDLYEVIGMSILEKDKSALVTYKSTLSGIIYSRPVEEWFEVVSKSNSGDDITRFTLVSSKDEIDKIRNDVRSIVLSVEDENKLHEDKLRSLQERLEKIQSSIWE